MEIFKFNIYFHQAVIHIRCTLCQQNRTFQIAENLADLKTEKISSVERGEFLVIL